MAEREKILIRFKLNIDLFFSAFFLLLLLNIGENKTNLVNTQAENKINDWTFVSVAL